MTLPVVILREAAADVAQAAAWFEEQRPGLGREFALSLDRELDNVARFPESCQRIYRSLRRAILHRFGYAVVYQLRAATVEVVAVMHCRRQAAVEERVSKSPGTMEQ